MKTTRTQESGNSFFKKENIFMHIYINIFQKCIESPWYMLLFTHFFMLEGLNYQNFCFFLVFFLSILTFFVVRILEHTHLDKHRYNNVLLINLTSNILLFASAGLTKVKKTITWQWKTLIFSSSLVNRKVKLSSFIVK